MYCSGFRHLSLRVAESFPAGARGSSGVEVVPAVQNWSCAALRGVGAVGALGRRPGAGWDWESLLAPVELLSATASLRLDQQKE